MWPYEFCFVDFIKPSTTQREKELERAAQKAHAARVSHKRRKEKAKFLQCSAIVKQDYFGSLTRSPQARSCIDPFDALGVEITPDVHRIIIFVAEVYTPSIYIPNAFRPSYDHTFPSQDLINRRSILGSVAVGRAIDHVFQYPEALPAWIYGSCFRLAEFYDPRDHARLGRLMLQYRAKSLQTLREATTQVAQRKAAPSVSLIMQALHLFIAELLYQEKTNAQAHVIVLSWIEQLIVDEETRVHLILNLIYSDSEMACKALKSTVLDFDDWLPSKLGLFWAYTATFLPPIPPEVEDVHPSLGGNQLLRETTLRLRSYLAMFDGGMAHRYQQPADCVAGNMVFTHLATTSCRDLGRLVNRLVEIDSGYHECWEEALDMALTLVVLYNTRKYFHEAIYEGMDFREAPLIVPKLEWATREVMRLSTVEQRWRRREELFWIFFTGAWDGQKVKLRRGINYDARYFNGLLSLQAHVMGLMRWSDAQVVLARFAFSDAMQPHPTQWYEHMIGSLVGEQKMISYKEAFAMRGTM